jgi:hypothetical protein
MQCLPNNYDIGDGLNTAASLVRNEKTAAKHLPNGQ